jgi:GAF domain-containing protein
MANLAPNDLAGTLAEAARELAGTGTVQDTLQRIVDLCLQIIPNADCAGITLLRDSRVTTPVASDLRVSELDAFQARMWEGPCMDAIRGHERVYSENLAEEARWPEFAVKAVERGMRSLLACRLSVGDEPLGALNLYSRRPSAFDGSDQSVATLFATHAAVALAASETHDDDVARALNLEEALESRDIIGQAKGVLMERQHIDAPAAFDILRRASQRSNVKVRDVAVLIVSGPEGDEGASPDPS